MSTDTECGAYINVVYDIRMPVLGELNERSMSIEEEREAVNEMKSGKAPGLDGFPVECLIKGAWYCSVIMDIETVERN